MVVGAVLTPLNPPLNPNEEAETVLGGIVWLSSFVGFGLVGALLVSTRPSNRIGWILTGITFSVGLGAFVSAYGSYALVTAPGTLPLGEPAAWLTTWGVMVPVTLLIVLVVLYPTASTTTTLGRFVMRVSVSIAVLNLAARALRPGPVVGDTAPPNNPLGVPGTEPFLDNTVSLLGTVLALLFLVAVFDLFVRYHRSRGVERQQFRWFLAAFAAFPILFVLGSLLEGIIGDNGIDPMVVVFPLWGIGAAAAIAIAITRHGLYEIDRIIARTVSYTVVVVALGAIYVAGVTWLSSLLPDQSQLVVAATTLAVATLFNPMRRRVQDWVDRRFNRSRYDTQRVMDGFAGSLRDQADTVTVVNGWVGVVTETMQPSSVAVWVRGEA
jgi:hypothetical protein